MTDWLDLDLDEIVKSSKPPQAPQVGARRYASLAARGASLGLLGTRDAPQGIRETLAEIAGEIPTVIGISAVLGPKAGALARSAKLPATAGRIGASTATGAVVGAVQGAARGDSVLGTAAQRAAEFGAIDAGVIAAGRALARIRGTGREVPVNPAAVASERSAAERAVIETSQDVATTPPVFVAQTRPLPRSAMEGGFNIYPPKGGGPVDLTPSPGNITDPIDILPIQYGPSQNVEFRRIPPRIGGDPLDPVLQRLWGGSKFKAGSVTKWDPERVSIDDLTIDRVRPSTVTSDFPKHFEKLPDPNYGEVYVPITQEATEVVTHVANWPLRYTPPPFTEEQISRIATRYPIKQNRDALTTSALLKRSADDVEKIVAEGDGAKIMDIVAVNRLPEIRNIDDAVNRLGLSEAELKEIAMNAPGVKPRHRRYKTPGPHPGREGRTTEELKKFGFVAGTQKPVKPAPLVPPKTGSSRAERAEIDRLAEDLQKVTGRIVPEDVARLKMEMAAMTSADRKRWIADEIRKRCR